MLVLERISCINFVEKDGHAFFSNRFYNGLFKVEIRTGKTVFLGCFEHERISKRNIHKEIFLKDEKIYFCPRRGRFLHIFDLKNHSIQAVELRSEQEKPFLIEEVVIGENDIFFVPDQNNGSVRKWNMETRLLVKIDEKKKLPGQYLSEHKERFPVPEFIGEYQIAYACINNFFGKWISDEVWYGFLPMGSQMLKYVKESNRLEVIPLVLMNEEELKDYLWKVKTELVKDKIVSEEEMSVQDWLSITFEKEVQNQNSFGKRCAGKNVWRLTKE